MVSAFDSVLWIVRKCSWGLVVSTMVSAFDSVLWLNNA
jgi:hypothetical protein